MVLPRCALQVYLHKRVVPRYLKSTKLPDRCPCWTRETWSGNGSCCREASNPICTWFPLFSPFTSLIRMLGFQDPTNPVMFADPHRIREALTPWWWNAGFHGHRYYDRHPSQPLRSSGDNHSQYGGLPRAYQPPPSHSYTSHNPALTRPKVYHRLRRFSTT